MAMSYQSLCTRRAKRLPKQRVGVLIAHTLLFIFGCGGETRPVTLDVRTDLAEELRDYVEESFDGLYELKSRVAFNPVIYGLPSIRLVEK